MPSFEVPLRHALSLALAVFAFFATAASPAQAQAQRRPITERDLFDFVWIGDPQIAPDGHSVAFVRTTVAPDRSGYQTALYTLDLTTAGAAPKLLTPGTHDTTPRWNPNSSQLAFLRAEEKDGKAAPPQLYLLDVLPRMTNPIRISDLPKGVSNPQWRPGGTVLAVLSLTPPDPARAKREAALKARSTGDDAHVSDVRIVDRDPYRSNGEGFLDPKFVPQIYEIAAPVGGAPQPPALQLTNRRFGVQEYGWAVAGSILYTSLPARDPASDFPASQPFQHNAIYVVAPPAPGNPPAQQPLGLDADPFPVVAVAEDLTVEARGLSIAPRPPGAAYPAHLAFHAQALPLPPAAPVSHQESDLFVLDLDWSGGNPKAAGPARNLTAAKGFEMGSGVGGDNTAPRGAGRTAIAWSADGKMLLDIAGSQGSALLLGIDAASGDVTRLTARQQAVLGFTALPDKKTIVALISNPIAIGDLFRIDPAGTPAGPHSGTAPPSPGNQTQLTDVNAALFSQLDLAMPQELHVMPTARPNDIPFLTIDTFVELPPHFDEKRKYPLILNIHGGPHSAYGWVFDHEMLWMAARGYVVDYPNPRGSTTYGQRFANVIENNYPGDDFHDLMDTVDAVIAKGWADPARMGVTGGSGGGLLTDWTVTHTDRFQAAVAQRDIADATAWWYTADIGSDRQYWWPGAPFRSKANLEIYRKLSPITYIDQAKTPMMFILGDADLRTPPTAGGEMMFRALKARCIPAVMVRFPRENHELSRSGEPWHRIERLDNIVNWFDLYLLKQPQPQYRVETPAGCKSGHN